MPIYGYACDCGERGEALRSFGDRDLSTTCPKCGGAMAREVSMPKVVIFKSGWYPNLDVKPVYIDSMQQLREESSKRNLTSAYEADNTVWKTKSNKWL